MRNWTVHLAWIIVILLFALCAVTIYSPDGAIIKDYVSFAGSIASIILASIAIIYAFISNQGVADAAVQLVQSTKSAESASHRVEAGAAAIEGALDTLRKDFSNLAPTVEVISKKLEEANFPFASSSEQTSAVVEEQGTLPFGLSPGIDGTLYTLALSSKLGQPKVNFRSIFPAEDEFARAWSDYCQGVATTLMGTRPCGISLAREKVGEPGETEFQVLDWGDTSPGSIIDSVTKGEMIGRYARDVIDGYFNK